MKNKFDRIIDYMKRNQIKSIVYISLIFIVFFTILIFLGFINPMILFTIVLILLGLIFVVVVAAAIVLCLTD